MGWLNPKSPQSDTDRYNKKPNAGENQTWEQINRAAAMRLFEYSPDDRDDGTCQRRKCKNVPNFDNAFCDEHKSNGLR